MAVNTAYLIFLPNKMSPISPNDTGIELRVSTNNKNVYNEMRAIAESNPVENKRPPL